MSTLRKAFTLIELLVVIAIIAILAAILFPVFAQAKEAAKKAADLSNVKNIMLALPMYATDYDGVNVMLRNGRPRWGCNGAPVVDCEQVNSAHNMLNPYVKNRDVWKAPNDSLVRNDCPSQGPNTPGGAVSYILTKYHDSWATSSAHLGSFGVFGWDSVSVSTGLSSVNKVDSLSETAVGSPASTIVAVPIYCTWSYWNGLMQHRRDQRWLAFDSTRAASVGAASPSLYISTFPKVDSYAGAWCGPGDAMSIGAYGGQTTFGFADGHVKSMRREATMDIGWVSDMATAAANNLKNLLHYDERYK